MKVSIITPSYNQARFIEETIQSVLNQTYSDIEYLVIDGGSFDGTVDILKKYENRLAAWVSEKDRGQTDAINKGFSMASGEIFAWLNSDDTLEPHAVARIVDFFQTNPDVGLVYGDANFINENDRVIGKFNAAQTDLKRLRDGFVHIPQQAAFFRSDCWKQIGPLDPEFYFAMDYDLWVRLAEITQIMYNPGVIANFRLHADAKTVIADKACWDEMLKIHYRDGGKRFSRLVIKYYLRKIAAPYILWKRKKLFTN